MALFRRGAKPEKKEKRFISLKEAAHRLAVNESSIRKGLCDTHELTLISLGVRRIVIEEADLNNFMERKVREARGRGKRHLN